jgi:exopolysaccharide production protein ExoQ
MPPTVALILWLILLLALLRFDPAREPETSLALWIPVIWMFIVGSRLPSQWVGSQMGTVAQVLEEGNPLDRAIFSILILLAVCVLILRGFNWGGFVSRNLALIAFVSFALASVLWSDFPYVAFKRWFRDLGSYFVILTVLSDPRPLEAARTLLRRFCYLIVPLSILLNKYYPFMAKQYGMWNGLAEITGAATSKNMLGAVCLVSGVFFFWDTVTRWSERKEPRTRRIILLNVAFLAMTLWLLNLANSATSQVCLVIGCIVIAAVHSGWGGRHFTFIRVLIPATFCLYLILAFGFGMNGQFASQIGRDPTLTGRSVIWKAVLSTNTNPLIGTGYESFWLGPRLNQVWEFEGAGGVNEAHNGYLEVYLNLGMIGVALLVVLLFSSYRTIGKRFTSSVALASFSLAMWTVILFYNVTEAAFRGGVMWLILLLVGIFVPERAEQRLRDAIGIGSGSTSRRFVGHPLETESQRRFSRIRPVKY